MEDSELHSRDFFSLSFRSFADQTKPSITKMAYGGPPDFGSNPDSPSGLRLTAEDEDDDEYVAELTRQMANYMLQDDEKHEKGFRGSGSPQSTLWSPFGSGFESPIGPSREPSPPPLTPAIEKFEKLKIKDETNPLFITAMNNSNTNSQFQSKQALIDQQIRSVQANFHKIKEEREKEKQRQRRRQNDGVFGNKGRGTPAKQISTAGYNGNYQRAGSGMKAVFVNGSGSRPGSVGTGVFLPRGTAGAAPDTRKKKGCSTVIIPARVVQALKLHFDKVGVPSRLNFDFPPRHDALLIAMNNNRSPAAYSQQQRGPRQKAEATATAKADEEPPADLPKEWTYYV